MEFADSVWSSNSYCKLREYLFSVSEESYRKFHSKLCKTSSYPILGVRLPEMQKIAKDIVKGDAISYLSAAKPQSYEEVMIKGLVTAKLKMPFSEKQKYIEHFLPYIDNWAVCDSFCASVKPKRSELSTLWSFCIQHISSDNEYEVRVSIILLMDYLLTDEYIDRVLSALNEVNCEKYYVSMAVAWNLSFCYIKFREKTSDFFKSCEIDDLTFNRAMQKILDSRRVSDADKNIIRNMKRK